MTLKWKICAALIPALFTAGCVSMRPTMTNFAIDYNRVVADTRNRMILLNIVRAAYREPTYYTAFNQIEGSLNVQASVSGEVADLLGGTNTAFKPTVNGSFQNAPTFTIVPLNSDEFAKGMLQPVGSDTILLFLSQGWRSRMLAPLVVQKVECIYHDKVVATFDNGPMHYSPTLGFSAWQGIEFSAEKATPPPALTFNVPAAKALELIAGGLLDKFGVDEKQTGGEAAMMTLTPPGSTQLVVTVPQPFRDGCSEKLTARIGDANSHLAAQFSASAVAVGKMSIGALGRPATADDSYVSVTFRSPDEIVYYLGEVLRAEMGPTPLSHAITRDGENLLFDALRNDSSDAVIFIEHRGSKWSIPATDPRVEDRSLEVISLLNQLIASQTTLKEFSRSSASVRVRP